MVEVEGAIICSGVLLVVRALLVLSQGLGADILGLNEYIIIFVI